MCMGEMVEGASHAIIEWFELEETFRSYLVQPKRGSAAQTGIPRQSFIQPDLRLLQAACPSV